MSAFDTAWTTAVQEAIARQQQPSLDTQADALQKQATQFTSSDLRLANPARTALLIRNEADKPIVLQPLIALTELRTVNLRNGKTALSTALWTSKQPYDALTSLLEQLPIASVSSSRPLSALEPSAAIASISVTSEDLKKYEIVLGSRVLELKRAIALPASTTTPLSSSSSSSSHPQPASRRRMNRWQ